MRILFAANTPDSRSSGIAKIMNCLAGALKNQGHSVDLLFRENIPGLPNSRRLSEVLFPFYLAEAIRKHSKQHGRPDIIALHSLAGAFYVFLRRWNSALPPCVIVSYGADEMRWELEREEERLGFRKIRLFSKIFYFNFFIRLARYAVQGADHVLVSARCEIDYFEKKYGLDRKKVTFVPNGVSENYFLPHPYTQPPRKLLYLGGWEWRKGIRYLAEAFSILADRQPDLTLSLVGIGVTEETAKASFPQKYHSRIFVTPKVSEDETVRVYGSHDIFVFPSLFESMSLVVPEAMASGLAVITTRACGMQDIIEDEVHGLLVRPRDTNHLAEQISRLLGNPAFAQKLGQAAQLKAREMTWDKVAQICISMYTDILSGVVKP